MTSYGTPRAPARSDESFGLLSHRVAWSATDMSQWLDASELLLSTSACGSALIMSTVGLKGVRPAQRIKLNSRSRWQQPRWYLFHRSQSSAASSLEWTS